MTARGTTTSDKAVLVGIDPWSDTLAVVPVEQARRDVALIRTLSESKKLGEVRKNPDAWARVLQWDPPDDLGRPTSEMPDDTPFGWVEWFGEDFYYLQTPLVRVQTGRHCPKALLEEFSHDDDGIGIDYERAPWFSANDQQRIEARLVELGYEVVHDPELLDGYQF